MPDIRFIKKNRFDEITGWREPLENPDASQLAVVSTVFLDGRTGFETLFSELGPVGFPKFFATRNTAMYRGGTYSTWVNAIVPLEYADGLHVLNDRGDGITIYSPLETVRAENLRDATPIDWVDRFDSITANLAFQILSSAIDTTKGTLYDLLESFNFQTITLLNKVYGVDMLRINGDSLGREDRWVGPGYQD